MKRKSYQLGYFFLFLLIVLIAFLIAGCTKREIKPQQTILWENCTNDTCFIFIDKVEQVIALTPYQSKIKGDESWLGKNYTIGRTSVIKQVVSRNRIVYETGDN